tara:strand:- start:161 stop:397 length:237 start_codon:yes stop_codon:yes gene_type:complete
MSKEKKGPSLPILKRVFPKTIPIAEFVTTGTKMSKEDILNKLLSNTIETTNPDTEHYDYPETEQYVPVWWIKQVLKDE